MAAPIGYLLSTSRITLARSGFASKSDGPGRFGDGSKVSEDDSEQLPIAASIVITRAGAQTSRTGGHERQSIHKCSGGGETVCNGGGELFPGARQASKHPRGTGLARSSG